MTYDFNFVNNVLFNWRHRSLDGGDPNSEFNVINNYYKPGPATLDNPVRYRILEPAQSWNKTERVSHWGKAYVAGNFVEGNPKVTADNWDGGVQFNKAPDPDASGEIAKGLMDDPEQLNNIIAQVRVDKPFPMAPVTMQTAKEAYESVLANAGATLPNRDSVDERAVRQTKTGITWGMGKEITPEPMKGWPKTTLARPATASSPTFRRSAVIPNTRANRSRTSARTAFRSGGRKNTGWTSTIPPWPARICRATATRSSKNISTASTRERKLTGAIPKATRTR